jgi:acetyl-CoA acyltransferase
LIELNEAFASSHWRLRIRIKSDIVNVNGGAIAMGHPLGCTGAKLSVQLFDEMSRGENMELLPCVEQVKVAQEFMINVKRKRSR